jgi:DNA-binding HxlR family transcriptional regulator
VSSKPTTSGISSSVMRSRRRASTAETSERRLLGVTRFDDIAEDLNISRKVLAARLARLVEESVLVRERYQDRPPREHYLATEKGEQLYPVLLALMDWGGRWYAGEAGPPALVRHLDCGRDTTPVTVCAHCAEPLTPRNSTQLPGPGGQVGPGTRVLAPLLAGRSASKPG